MGIPIGPLREALAAARMAGPAVAKATKKTIRVLHNEGDIDSLTGMLRGKPDYNAKATFDDMMYPSRKTSAGYAKDGYSAASMAKLPKGTVTNRAGSGAMRARVMGLARSQELSMKSDVAAKRKALANKKRPVKGSITRPVKSPIEGPKSSDVSKVDNLFGVGNAPMGYKYGSRK